jgi:hypothetical protein
MTYTVYSVLNFSLSNNHLFSIRFFSRPVCVQIAGSANWPPGRVHRYLWEGHERRAICRPPLPHARRHLYTYRTGGFRWTRVILVSRRLWRIWCMKCTSVEKASRGRKKPRRSRCLCRLYRVSVVAVVDLLISCCPLVSCFFVVAQKL